MKINVIEVLKEFSNSNISKMELKYKKLELKLEKDENGVKICKNKNQDEYQKWITSPIVGKISKIEVKPGDVVKKGNLICTIEAMKTFNEIRAENDYTVLKIEAQENNVVEYGQNIVLVGNIND